MTKELIAELIESENELTLSRFLEESNRIEGFDYKPSELTLAKKFLDKEWLTVDDIIRVVGAIQPDAKLRVESGMNVAVGNHVPPAGSVAIGYALDRIIQDVNDDIKTPYEVHCEYEELHPFGS